MTRKDFVGFLIIVVLSFFAWGAQPTVSTMAPGDLETIITGHTVDFDFILIDVREVSEVKDGIIASKYCKPYHLAWTSGEFKQQYTELPKEAPIIVCCRTGNRSMQAATFLVENGFTSVALLSGGINSYDGTLADSTEFNALSELPQFSYFGMPTTVLRSSQKQRAVIITDPAARTGKRFNLQGRSVSQSSQQRNAPVYILERIGEGPTGSVRGISRLLHQR
jgi:rhodanese-related sulfurtransferase